VQAFAWDDVRVAADGRSLRLSGIHSAPWTASGDTWWVFSRIVIEETDKAVCVRVLLMECGANDPGAMRSGDPRREVRCVLDRALGGRTVIDGCARLVEPHPSATPRPKPKAWHRIRQADDQTLIVYWNGGPSFPLDHVSADWGAGALYVTVWLRGGGGRLAGQYQATIVRLDRSIDGLPVLDGARQRGEIHNRAFN
jgi:hypothetical protein